MRLRVRAAPPEHLGWIVQRTGFAPTGGCRAIEAVDAAGRIRGMVAFDGWTENACHAHMAVESPIAWRALLAPAFGYAFDQCGRGIILGVVPAGNARSCALTRRFGFREVHRIKDGWAEGEDLVVHEMRKNECRWLNGHNRKAA